MMHDAKDLQNRIDKLEADKGRLLQENEGLKRRAAYIDHIADAVASAEPESCRLLSWNRAAERLYGFSEAEVLGRTISDVTRRDYLGTSRDDIIRIVRDTGHWEGRVREYHKDGTRLDVHASVSKVMDSNGKTLELVAVNRDISRLCRTETLFNQQQNAFRIIAEAAVFAGSIENLCQRIIDELVATLGFDIGSVRLLSDDGRSLIAAAVTGVDADRIAKLTPAQRVDDPYYLASWVYNNRTPFFAPDVSQHPVSESHSPRLQEVGIKSLISWPLIDSDGVCSGVLHLVGIKPRQIDESDRHFFETVTRLFALLLKRKQTEEALRLSEENYSSIFHNIQDSFFRVGLDGCLEMLNPSGVRLLGYDSSDEVVGKPVAEAVYYYPEDRPKILAIFNREGVLKDQEVALRRKDGSKIVAELNAYFRKDQNGNRIAMEGILRDTTARKKLEQELLNAQKLESIGLLAGGLAHDFNNILTAVLGNISLAKNMIDADSRAVLRLGKAEDACLRARDITQQLLTFSRGGEPVRKIADVGSLLVQTVGFSLRGSSVRAEYDVPIDLWAAEIDTGQISQAINNLVINALQAMPDGGRLSVSASNGTRLDPDTQSELPEILIQVKDTGHGMDTDILSQVFNPYFTTKTTGSGLGLTTVYSIVKKHGGTITVQSEPQQGTTVEIRLPATPGVSPEDPGPGYAIRNMPGRILMMDDDETILDVARLLFSDMAIEFHSARDGAEAIETYQRALDNNTPFDVIIIDLTIPGGMGGKETMKHLRAIDPNVCAVVSSGYSDDPVMANYKEFGFSARLRKPYDIRELCHLITELILAGKNRFKRPSD